MAAMLSFHILQKGIVGIAGSTGAVLGRSLRALRAPGSQARPAPAA